MVSVQTPVRRTVPIPTNNNASNSPRPYSSFLLPRPVLKASQQSGLAFQRFGVRLFRRRNANLFAAPLILRFSQQMISAINAASKLCADIRTTLRSGGFQPPAFAQLGKGGTPVASPSAASGEWKLCRFPRLQARAAPRRLHHWAVRP
jgi:hypothetical protein